MTRFRSSFSFLPVLFLLFILIGAGCAGGGGRVNAPAGSDAESETESSSSDSSTTKDEKESPLAKGRAGKRHILLVDASCDVEKYTDQAKSVFRQKEVDPYIVVMAEFEENVKKNLTTSDPCLKMSFPAKEVKSLKEMLALLSAELQKDMDETEVNATVQEDLPGTCEDVAEYVAQRFPQFKEEALARCEKLQEQREQEEEDGGGDEELTYDGTSAQCGTVPDKSCSPSMSAEEYIKYTMPYVTPSDATVVTEAGKYKNIDSLYLAMQKRPWESDTAVFGCSDKFQKPNYYLTTAPTLETSMMCGVSVGDCSDKANTFASLLIASGLFDRSHVRVAMGMVQFGSRPMDIGGHAWTEVYLEDEAHWIQVDSVFGYTCYDSGKCAVYEEEDLIPWDYFNFVQYPVVEYWGWANDEWFYISSTKQASQGLPAYWKEEAKTIYEAGI